MEPLLGWTRTQPTATTSDAEVPEGVGGLRRGAGEPASGGVSREGAEVIGVTVRHQPTTPMPKRTGEVEQVGVQAASTVDPALARMLARLAEAAELLAWPRSLTWPPRRAAGCRPCA